MADVTADSREGRDPQGATPDASATTGPEAPDSETGLDRPRPSVSYLEPVAWADPPTDGFAADPD